MATSQNYTAEMVEDIVASYQADPSPENIEAMAQRHERSPRSIRAKLSSEGVYVRQQRVGKTKTGEAVIKKADLVADIVNAVGVELPSLEKATKADLQNLLSAVRGD